MSDIVERLRHKHALYQTPSILEEAADEIERLRAERNALRDGMLDEFLSWRGISPSDACKRCGGSGTRIYGSTSTWQGGIGGQMITSDVCDNCWGSGSQSKHWPSHRAADAARKESER